MTVLTKLSAEQKDEKGSTEPLFVPDTKNVNDVEIAAPPTSRRWGAVKTAAFVLLLLFLIATAVPASMYLYRHYLARKYNGHFRGWCRVPVDNPEARPRVLLLDDTSDASFVSLDEPSKRNEVLRDPFEQKMMDPTSDMDSSVSAETVSSEMSEIFSAIHSEFRRFLDEVIDIDAEEENVKIQVPKFGMNREGRFLHDFRSNYTVIVDVDGGRCFVIPLDQDLIMPPSNFLDLLMRTLTGYYDRVVNIVRETTRVVVPAIEDTEYLGPLINNQCSGYPIFKLERITNPIFKRSLDTSAGGHFLEYTGSNLVEMNIMNIAEAVGKPMSF